MGWRGACEGIWCPQFSRVEREFLSTDKYEGVLYDEAWWRELRASILETHPC